MTEADVALVLEAMKGRTGSATLHFKNGKLMKVEYKYSESVTSSRRAVPEENG